MHDNIQSHLVEKRVFEPPRDFSRRARVKSLGQYRQMYRESIRHAATSWPARESVRCIRLSSADLAPIAFVIGSSTAARSQLSLPTVHIEEAGLSRLREMSMTHSVMARQSGA